MEQRGKMAPVGGVIEIDPVFLKALKLLHSKHPDSLEQLRALRDEVIRQHNQPVPPISKDKIKESKPVQHPEKRPSTAVSTSDQKSKLPEKKHEVETIQVVSSNPDPVRTVMLEEAGVETIEIGESDLIETVELSSSSFIETSSSKRARLQFDVDDVLDEGNIDSRSQVPVDDLIIDWGSVCGICYRDDSKIAGNQLVECHECHSLYHQRCHEPRVMDSEVNDPRHVWYCAQCVRKMREMATSASPKSKPTETVTSSTKTAGMGSRPTPLLPFKRPSVSDSKPVASPTTQQSFAIPALSPGAMAAKTSSTSGSTSSQNVAMQSAMKRLQMVKKKAQQRVFNHQQIRIPRR